jgi:hypothetical protein
MNTFHTKLVGVTRKNIDGTNRQDVIEDLEEELAANGALELGLRREPHNPFDRNAVAVLAPDGRQLGYFSATVAEALAPVLDCGAAIEVVAVAVTGGGLTHHYGVNVKVSSGEAPSARGEPRRDGPRDSDGPEWISTAEFLARARRLGLDQVAISLDYQVGDHGHVQRFNFVLMGPFAQQATAQPGQVDHLSELPPQLGPLRGVLGRDDEGNVWFLDGYRLPAGQDFLDGVRRDGLPIGRRVSAEDRVLEFFTLLERLDRAGLQPQIIGSGIGPVVQWAQYTMRAATEPEFREEVERALGPVRRSRS